MNRTIISLVLALISLPMFGNYGVRNIDLGAAAVEQVQVWDTDDVRKMIGSDYSMFYHGTWNDWHMFSFSGGSSLTNRSSCYGIFRTKKTSIHVPDSDFVDISDRQSVSGFECRRLIAINGASAEASLSPKLSLDAIAADPDFSKDLKAISRNQVQSTGPT